MAVDNFLVVRRTDKQNRIVEVLGKDVPSTEQTATTTAYNELPGTYDIVTIDGSSLSITDANDLVGKYRVDANNGTPTAWTQSVLDQVAARRDSIHAHLAQAYYGFRGMYSSETVDAITYCRRYLLKIYATASSDTVIGNNGYYSTIEEAAKINLNHLFKAMMASETRRTNWDNSLKGTETNFYGYDSNYDPVAKANIEVPSNWDTHGLETIL